jgi:RHS repeat-associated protein
MVNNYMGLLYYGARYIDPRASVFLGVDPKADKYPGWSVYAYCMDNPIRLIDPNGMEAGEPGGHIEPPQISSWISKPIVDNIVPYAPGRGPANNSNQPTTNELKETLTNVNNGVNAVGIAATSGALYTKAYAPPKIAYNSLTGANKISSAKVVSAFKGAGKFALGASIITDVTLTLTGNQSLGKTILNTAMGTVLPFALGTSAGLTIGIGYTVLDQLGAFNGPSNLTPYVSPLYPADATNVVPLLNPLTH